MFNTVGIVGFLDRPLVRETIIRLDHCLAENHRRVLVETNLQKLVPELSAESCSRDQLGDQVDLIIVVGGDGSMLHAARDLVEYDVPLLGVNRGRLGFLTDIKPAELELRVADVLAGNYVTTSRFMLDCDIMRGTRIIETSAALNDVVLQPRTPVRMIESNVSINGQYAYNLRSDGLIVATPTGSTAYALSGGGPVLHPELEAINLVPINPHTLSHRPLVVKSDSEIQVSIARDNQVLPQVVCDGQNFLNADLGDVVRIRRKARTVQLIHPVQHDFYHVCRTKLNWATH